MCAANGKMRVKCSRNGRHRCTGGVNGKELNTQCLGNVWGKKNASYQSSVRVKSSVFVGIFILLFIKLMTAAKAGEHPSLGALQEVVLPQIGRRRTFVRIAVVVSVRRIERDQRRTHMAKHFLLKSSAASSSTMPDGIGGACLEEYSYEEDVNLVSEIYRREVNCTFTITAMASSLRHGRSPAHISRTTQPTLQMSTFAL